MAKLLSNRLQKLQHLQRSRAPKTYNIILIGQKPVKAKIMSMTPTSAVKMNQLGFTNNPRSELPSTNNPAVRRINLSRYHVFVSARYIPLSPFVLPRAGSPWRTGPGNRQALTRASLNSCAEKML
jgi:hypothetical protein